ncbi:MAG TPA: selenium-dependent molybdenum cofactor biosynthesis protein YqeB [Chloroflexota bacterium]
MTDQLIVVRGGGDLGSGVALRLARCGFRIVVLEQPDPIAVRRTVSFSEAVYERSWKVEEVEGRLAYSSSEALNLAGEGMVAVLVDPAGETLHALAPEGLVDAIMAKHNTGTHRMMARAVVALGPGFTAGVDCHTVVETNRGPHLGRCIWTGRAELDTGEPGPIAGKTGSRVLRAPREGRLTLSARIGEIVAQGARLADVSGKSVCAPFRGLVRGLARDGLTVKVGMKIGDVDPRLDPELCLLASDKALAVAGGVMEALCMVLDRSA